MPKLSEISHGIVNRDTPIDMEGETKYCIKKKVMNV